MTPDITPSTVHTRSLVSQSLFNDRLASYAIAAGATLIGTTSQAAIIYQDLAGFSEAERTATASQALYLDINAATPEGIFSRTSFSKSDFELVVYTNGKSGNYTYTTNFGAAGLTNSFVLGGVNEGDIVGAFVSGYGNYTNIVNTSESTAFSPDTSGYLGIRFEIDHQSYNGWVHLTVTDTVMGEVRINSFAYDTTGGDIVIGARPIPEPGALALLATGAAGLATWRGRRRSRNRAA